MESKNFGKTSTGIQAPVAGLLCYVLGWVSGLIFFLIEKENKFVRFHAMQSMVVFGALFVLQIVIGMLTAAFVAMRLSFMIPVFSLANALVILAGFVLWIMLMIKAYQGERFKLPVAGDIAGKNI